MWLLRHIVAIAVLPGTVTILVPALIVEDARVTLAGAIAGAVLIGAGLSLWTWTVRLFARIGRGTLAPWDPTRRLVVEGPYRHCRNPMISAVLAILLGEAAAAVRRGVRRLPPRCPALDPAAVALGRMNVPEYAENRVLRDVRRRRPRATGRTGPRRRR